MTEQLKAKLIELGFARNEWFEFAKEYPCFYSAIRIYKDGVVVLFAYLYDGHNFPETEISLNEELTIEWLEMFDKLFS